MATSTSHISRPTLSVVPVSFSSPNQSRAVPGRYQSRSAHPASVPFYACSTSEKIRSNGHDPESGLNSTRERPSGTTWPYTSDIAQMIEERLWRYSIFSDHIAAQWLLEISSIVVSAVSMIAVISVLAHLDAKPAPKHPIILNVYVVVLSKLATVTLLLPVSQALGQLKWSWFQGDKRRLWDFEIFDNASRGPWGCFLLLLRTRCKSFAALGAAITLLSLALDPFFQQAVNFPIQWAPQKNGTSSISVVTRYETTYTKIFLLGETLAQADPSFLSTAEAFLYSNGTQPLSYGNGPVAQIPLICPTSKCTWPVYRTLGVCSACTNISNLLTYACLTTKVDWTLNTTGGYGAEKTYPDALMCGYFVNATSDLPVMMSGYEVTANKSVGEALLMRAMPLITNPMKESLWGGSINFKHIRNPIQDFLIVSASDGAASVYRNETPTAHECVLSWCVKAVESSFDQDVYTEKVVDTFINTTTGPFPWTSRRVDGGTEVHYTENITITPDDTLGGRGSSDENVHYGLSNQTAFDIITIFTDFLPSFSSVQGESAPAIMRFNVGRKPPTYTRLLDYNPWMPPSNITSHVSRLATALTNDMRSSTWATEVSGTEYALETFVSVRWPWLTLHITLLCLSVLFLIVTILRSKFEQDSIGIFKTSAIATLMHGLPDKVQEKFMASQSSQSFENRSEMRTMRARMQPQKGWRVSGYEASPITPRLRHQPPPGWI